MLFDEGSTDLESYFVRKVFLIITRKEKSSIEN